MISSQLVFFVEWRCEAKLEAWQMVERNAARSSAWQALHLSLTF